jgi:hypothetical protein
MKCLALPLSLVGIFAMPSFLPACSQCTASATVYVGVEVTDRVTRLASDVAQVTIDGRPCASLGKGAYSCEVTDAEGTFEVAALLDGRRSTARVEVAANGCGGESRGPDVVRMLP